MHFQCSVDQLADEASGFKIVHASYTVPVHCDFLILSGSLDDVRHAMKTYLSRYRRPHAVFWVLYSGVTVDAEQIPSDQLPDLFANADTTPGQFRLMISQLLRQVRLETTMPTTNAAIPDQQLNDKKHQFLVLTNHELRTPATIISGALDILGRQKHHLPEQLQRMVSCAQNGSERLNKLLEDITYLIDDQPLQPSHATKTRPLLLLVLMEQVRQQYAKALDERNIELSIEIGEKHRIAGCPEELFTLFSHLVSNAIKSSPDGESIQIRSQVSGKQICIQVIDHGKGLSRGSERHLFEPFYREGNLRNHHSSQVTSGGGGLGLGLPVCKQIVQQHQGSICIKSNAAAPGVTVTIFLPQPETVKSDTAFPEHYFDKNPVS